MQAVIIREFGGPEVLQYEDVPAPVPAADEVLIRVHAVSVNRSFDLEVRKDGNRRDPLMPLVMGADPSGVVVAVGDAVQGVQVGDHVASRTTVRCRACAHCQCTPQRACLNPRMIGVHRWGGYAELAAVPVEAVTVVPRDVPFPEITVVVRHFPAAFALVHRRAGLQAGETALVMGAAGALGSALVQVAKLAGATVIAAAGADERVAAGMQVGADHGVNYRTHDLAAEVLRLTDGQGADTVFENSADPSIWPAGFRSLAQGGRLVMNGAHAGPVVALDCRQLYMRSQSIIGGGHATEQEVAQALAAAAAGEIRPLIGAVLPLERVREAHELAERNQVIGKVILVPPGANGRASV